MLLERANQTDRRGQEGAQGAPPRLTPLPAKLPAGLLAPNTLLPSLQEDKAGRVTRSEAPDSAAEAAAVVVRSLASNDEHTVKS